MSQERPPDQAELVDQLSAFLDGELDPAARRDVEELLTTSEEARAELKRLEQAWDFLDELPRSEVSPSFTQTTVAMIALRASEDTEEKRSSPATKWSSGWLVVTGALLMAALAGFLIANMLTYLVAFQVYGDPFIGFLLGFGVGLLLSAPRLVAQQRWLQPARAAAVDLSRAPRPHMTSAT